MTDMFESNKNNVPGRHLVVSRDYPSYARLYKYPFVHRRILGYREHGFGVDVFSLGVGGDLSSYEFEQVNCLTGSQQALSKLLETVKYESIVVHGFSREVWPTLRPFMDETRVIGWLHGSEIHSLHRYATMGKSQEECEDEEQTFQRLMVFWREVLNPMPEKLELVFVSQFAAVDAMRDLGFELPKKRYHVIPNPIDTQLFNYVPKPDSQRKKILSIRPFDTTRYANDLSVKTILALAEKPFFDDLEFRIIGDGPLFDTTLQPLRDFKNVTIEQRFIRQHEVADLYKEFGVLLVPTRMDTHGVSRDEAMASGMVALTNNVTAIPEYADETCAILAGADEYLPLARGIENMYSDPALFQTLSRAAERQVQKLTSNDIIIPREIELISGQSFMGVKPNEA
jgi:glycosyltransferase involved in cell wall biosynthesis